MPSGPCRSSLARVSGPFQVPVRMSVPTGTDLAAGSRGYVGACALGPSPAHTRRTRDPESSVPESSVDRGARIRRGDRVRTTVAGPGRDGRRRVESPRARGRRDGQDAGWRTAGRDPPLQRSRRARGHAPRPARFAACWMGRAVDRLPAIRPDRRARRCPRRPAQRRQGLGRDRARAQPQARAGREQRQEIESGADRIAAVRVGAVRRGPRRQGSEHRRRRQVEREFGSRERDARPLEHGLGPLEHELRPVERERRPVRHQRAGGGSERGSTWRRWPERRRPRKRCRKRWRQ